MTLAERVKCRIGGETISLPAGKPAPSDFVCEKHAKAGRLLRCSQCGEWRGKLDEVVKAEWDRWKCDNCAEKKLSQVLVDFIRERIAVVNESNENHERLVLREIVQNADDAGAETLIVRFEPEALFIANDGGPFTTADAPDRKSDFARISRVLGRHKAEEKDSTGHFGSGFQTVYALTNSPEVHSNGRSGRMDPVHMNWEFYGPSDDRRMVSPYSSNPDDRKGALFRLPWRTSAEARSLFKSEYAAFAEAADFPRWDAPQRRAFYDALKAFAHEVLLCANSLRRIRLAWAASDDEETFQVERSFTMTGRGTKTSVETVIQGTGDTKKHPTLWTRRNDVAAKTAHRFFAEDSWTFKPKPTQYRYLVGSGIVQDQAGRTLYTGRKRADPDREVIVTAEKIAVETELKRNDVHLLLPLFNFRNVSSTGGHALLYSTIPLPRKSQNLFIFTGHFFPAERRTDVAARGPFGEWHQAIVLSAARLYAAAFDRFVQEVRASNESAAEAQRIILSSVPGIRLHQWMRPGIETEDAWASQWGAKIVATIVATPILWTGLAWVEPRKAFHTRGTDGVDPTAVKALGVFGLSAFTKEFAEHSHYSTLTTALASREFGPQQLADAIRALVDVRGSAAPGRATKLLAFAPKAKPPTLSEDEVRALINYCLLGNNTWDQARTAPIVPGEDGYLRAVTAYPLVPDEFAALLDILTPDKKIHKTFTGELAAVEPEKRTITPDRVVDLISEAASQTPNRITEKDSKNHAALSRLLLALARHEGFAHKQAYAPKRLLPSWRNGKLEIVPPNTKKGGLIYDGRRPEQYERDFVFEPPEEAVSGITQEVIDRIRLLCLSGLNEDEATEVAKCFHILDWGKGQFLTNFVRHFLSDRHQSLFRDDVLSAFLGPSESAALSSQKKQFLMVLQAYYEPDRLKQLPGEARYGKQEDDLHPDHMGKVPCLYDAKNKWYPAKEFAINLTKELEILDYKALHADFEKWDPRCLEAIGAAMRPQPATIVKVVKEIIATPEKKRPPLANIVGLIVSSRTPWGAAYKELQAETWVPTREGKLRPPPQAVWPSPRTQETVGPDFGALVDLQAMSKEMRSALETLDEETLNARLTEVGIPTQPTLEQVLESIPTLVKTGRPPPPRLFEELSRLVAGRPPVNKGHFYTNGKWITENQMLDTADANIMNLFGSAYTFIPEGDSKANAAYLAYIGVRRIVGPLETIEMLKKTANPQSAHALWEQLDASNHTLRTKAQTAARGLTYDFDGRKMPLEKLVLVTANDESPRPRSTMFLGDRLFLSTKGHPHAKALSYVGVADFGDLDDDALTDILERAAGQPLTPEAATTCTILLANIAKHSAVQQLGKRAVWPTQRGATWALRPASEVHVRDHPLAVKFDAEFNWLLDRIEGELVTDIRDLAREQGPPIRRFSDEVRQVRDEPIAAEPDAAGTQRLQAMANALSHMSRGRNQPKPPLDWLKGLKMEIADAIRLPIKLPGQPDAEITCILQKNLDDRYKVLRIRAHPDLHVELANLLDAELRERGLDLPESWRSIFTMLRTQPSTWALYVAGAPSTPPAADPAPMMETREDEAPESKPGYPEVRQRFQEWYGACQICGRRTPADENGTMTVEDIRSVVSKKSRYDGPFDRYEVGNAMFLCPLHATLFERSLVRFPILENNSTPEDQATKLRDLSREWEDEMTLEVQVFDWDRARPRPGWSAMQQLTIKRDHARALLNYLANWVTTRDGA